MRSHYRTTFNDTSDRKCLKDIHRAGKINKPDPTNVHFLFENPRFINEPVCHAATKVSRHVQNAWWPDGIPSDIKPKPTYSLDSSSRAAFGPIDSSKRPRGLTRFSCIDGRRPVAIGIVPVTELPASRIKTERISYNHQYDSRKNMRERGKLHGSFVWDTTDKNGQKMQRRFAKRNFVPQHDYDAREPSVYSGRAPEAVPLRSFEKEPNVKSPFKNIEKVEAAEQRSNAFVPQKEAILKVQKEPDTLQLPSKALDRVKTLHSGNIDSPPPHLC